MKNSTISDVTAMPGGDPAHMNGSLMLITESSAPHAEICHVVRESLLGGVTHVILRRTHESARDMYSLAISLMPVLAAANVPMIINDRLDLALALDHVGVHIGRQSLPSAVARRLVPNRLLGSTVHKSTQAAGVSRNHLDYLMFGHVFPNDAQPNRMARGVAELSNVVAAVSLPVVAIGGITEERISTVLSAGASGVAVARAISRAESPRLAARALRDAIDTHR